MRLPLKGMILDQMQMKVDKKRDLFKILGYLFIVVGSSVLEAQRLEFVSLGLISGAGGALGSELGELESMLLVHLV